MDDDGPIARNVRLRMEAKGFNPKRLSLAASLNETYVRDLLKGKSLNPRNSHLQKLAFALDCRVSDLTGELDPVGADETASKTDIRRELLGLVEAMTEEQRQALLTMAKVMVPPEKPGTADHPTKLNPTSRRSAA